ncbi:beta-glucosidase BglX [Sphingobacterium daejeonense]|uniref:beta-glucosidase BglX n=1 Tax=Sphingobacterium daejeonense TaxID=371142 RepID=UPI0010C4619F|nr:beta-glucosidase BglX [Sphingobacterium daejeonense]VTP98616.1 Periplasmic beta-glucosidase precursor [Sphingobacterium daejeonense]
MKLLKNILCIAAVISSNLGHAQENQKMNQFINDLMSKMTVEEKIGQLNLVTAGEATTGSVVSTDVESKIKAGNIGGIFSMTTPSKIRKAQELAVNNSRLKIPIIFGMDVIHGYKTIFPIPLGLAATWDMPLIQKTARVAAIEASADGLNWTFSPMVDISRDARWGRISEGSGEDTYLSARIAREMVIGYQGDDLSKNNTLMACVKHFALYGAAEAGRDYHTTDMSLHRMYNEYLPPYKAALDAGALSIMTSFNDINGIPATANHWLLTDLLRDDWKFNGLVVTDYTAVNELIDHGLGDLQKVSELSLKAGVDMDMVGEGFLTTLKKSLDEGKVTLEEIDRACRYVLEAKYRLGLFDDPFKYCSDERAKNEILTPEHLKLAREAAGKSFVLLKNDNQTLPLKEQGTVAVIGPLANTGANMPGTWSVSAELANTMSLVDGMKSALGNKVKIVTHLGSNLTDDAALQERSTMFGRTIPRDDRDPQQIIDEAINTAKDADVIIAALGESSEMSGESSSRTDLNIPESQKRLLQALLKTGKPVVLVLFAGRPLTLTWENENVPAILNVWFGGTETGKAVADVLFGDVNPSGKLPATFPQNVGQLPIYYSQKNTGRPLGKDAWFQKFRSNYLDVNNEPLYPFGYGLSYTNFTYSNLKLDKNSITKADSLKISVNVRNNGNYDGEEVVQLYLQDLVGSQTRPIKELKGFQKVFIEKGKSKDIVFTITEEDLKFYNQQLEFISEPGKFKVFIGTNSRDVQEAEFDLID